MIWQKEYQDMNDKIYNSSDDYYKDHNTCPNCKSVSYISTYEGFVFRKGEPYKDENVVRCSMCGWIGITDDLIEK